MRKTWFRGIAKEVLIQLLTVLISSGIVVFILPPEVLTYNLWGSQDLDKPLTREYILLCMMVCNMIRLSVWALTLFFRKNTQPEQSRLSYIYSHP